MVYPQDVTAWYEFTDKVNNVVVQFAIQHDQILQVSQVAEKFDFDKHYRYAKGEARIFAIDKFDILKYVCVDNIEKRLGHVSPVVIIVTPSGRPPFDKVVSFLVFACAKHEKGSLKSDTHIISSA